MLLDDERFRRLEAVAERRRVAVAVIVREAIDRHLLVPTEEQRAAAVRRILAAEPMPVGSVDELRAEIADAHDRVDAAR